VAYDRAAARGPADENTVISRTARLRRPRVLDLVAGEIVWEQGTPAAVANPDRLAILVHYSDASTVSRSFRTLVQEFACAGYTCVVVSSSPARQPLDWSGGLPPEVIVIRKPNVGYDFGSWTVGLNSIPGSRRAEAVVLANDSVVGPFRELGPIIKDFEATGADAWGLTDTRQYFHHLQSYFLGFRRGVLAEPALATFWDGVRHERTKWDVIRRNELALSALLYQEGYSTTAAFRCDDFVPAGENPVIRAWWRLLERGYPFVKRQIITEPEVAPRSDMVVHEVRALFGLELAEWL
jgi:hypothetical protein